MSIYLRRLFCRRAIITVAVLAALTNVTLAEEPTRVFIFAGQSNMVGADSRVTDIDRYPPFRGLDKPQSAVKFFYCIGRENKQRSAGWVDLQPVNNLVGPELSFARQVAATIDAPIAIIKVAAGGTHLGGDWNPDNPQGFQMYPLALETVKQALTALDNEGIDYRIDGFMWHQGENDMFNEQYMANYGKNLSRYMECWRRDLKEPNLKFYVGELCTKTIWGMDLRPRMYAISKGQRQVTDSDPLAEYVPTAHVGVEIGGGVGLHYHYGTLGQLEHGINYATAYLRSTGQYSATERPLKEWPFPAESRVRLFVLAGHRNMEGERAFVQDLPANADLLRNNPRIPFRYSIGGGYKKSAGWEPMGPAGYYSTFGPELSFASKLQEAYPQEQLAVVKFTHSGSQMNDWTPAGSMASSRHIYPAFISYIKDAISDLERRGHEVEVEGVFYHVGENDMSMPPYRKQAADWLAATIQQSRIDLERPDLQWYISQQPPTNHERVNEIDIVAAIEEIAAVDSGTTHIKAFSLPRQDKQLVINTEGIVALGKLLAEAWVMQ